MRVYLALSAFIFMLIVGVSHSQNTTDNCEYTCKASEKNQNDNGNYVLRLDSGISYFYMKDQNTLIVYNENKRFVMVLDGNTNTLTIVNVDTGTSLIINLLTDESYVTTDKPKKFDMSQISKDNYQVIIDIYNYNLGYIPKVTGDNPQNTVYIIDILRDIENTTDTKKWNSFKDKQDQIGNLKYFQDIIITLHTLLENHEYNVEMGSSLFAIYISDYYKTDDPLLKYLTEFLLYQVQSMKGNNMEIIMPKLNDLITSGYNMSYIKMKFEMLNWAIIGVNFTYFDMDDAMNAYDNNNVVQTHVTSITDKHNQTYLAYSSMRNGTWHLRITYGNTQFVEITGSFSNKHLVIWDPSVDLALVFPEGGNFGMINRKTGSGLVLNGKNNKAVFVIANDSPMVDAFNSGNIPQEFAIMTKLVLDTTIDDKAFQGDQLLLSIRSGSDLSTIITDQQALQQFQNDFSYLIENLNKMEYIKEYGVVNLVSFMLINTQSDFFQEGFVKMMFKMYEKDICLKEFFMIMYAGILNSQIENWETPIFQNICDLLDLVKNKKKPMDTISLIEKYTTIEWNINVTSEEFLERGITVI